MKALGWIYLGLYLFDAGLSAVASYVPSFLLVSNALSTVVLLFTIVVFVLTCLRKLRPASVFLILCCYYFLLNAFGFFLGVLALVRSLPLGQAELFELAVKRRSPDLQPPRDLRHLPAVVRDGEADGLGFDLLQRTHVAVVVE